MGRGPGWKRASVALLEADRAAGLSAAAIARKHAWNVVTVRRALKKLQEERPLVTQAKHGKITEEISKHIEEEVAAEKSLKQISESTNARFGVVLFRSSISRHIRLVHQKKSVKKVRTFHLKESNREKRLTFCQNLLPRLKLSRNRLFGKSRPGIDVSGVVFTDEKFFRLENPENGPTRIWIDSKSSKRALLRSGSSRARSTKTQRAAGVMVSGGICLRADPPLLGPFFIDDNCKVNSEVYCRILEDNYVPVMAALPGPIWWQEDNAPSHSSAFTKNWKKAHFPYQHVGWPATSPDLAPMDYGIWKAIAAKLPADKIANKSQLKIEVAKAFRSVSATDLPQKTVAAFQKKLEQCVAANGGHFEA